MKAMSARTASRPVDVPVPNTASSLPSTSPPSMTTRLPETRQSVSAWFRELVKIVRPGRPTSSQVSAAVVVPESISTEPASATMRAAWRAIAALPSAFSSPRCAIEGSIMPRRAAPPWTTSRWPWSSSSFRSRRMVSCETPKTLASSPTLTDPAARKRWTISLCRRTASGRTIGAQKLQICHCAGTPATMTSPRGIFQQTLRSFPRDEMELARWRVSLRECAVVVEHRLQQDLSTSRALLLRGVLRLVVADPIPAGDKYHRGWRDARNVCCVVPGAGNNFAGGKSAQRGRAAHRRDTLGIEAHRRLIPDASGRHRKPQRIADLGQGGLVFGFELIQHGVFRMAQVDAEEHLTRDYIAGVRPHLHQPDRAERVRLVRFRDCVDAFDQPRGAKQRILAQPHRRGTGMGCLTRDRHLVPAHALHAGNDADLLFLGFEDWSLLDVQLEEGRERMISAALIAAIADGVERRAEGCSFAILIGVRPLMREGAGEHAGCHHRGRKARALLVGPVDHLDRRVSFVAGAHHRAERFQCAKNAKNAIELAAGRLRVEMAPHGDRRDVVPLARTARVHRAHVVNCHGAAERLAARLEPVAHLPVGIGQREPADAAPWRATDLGGLHQLAPEPLAVDLQVLHRRGSAAKPYAAFSRYSAAPGHSFGAARIYWFGRTTSAPSSRAAIHAQCGSSSMARPSAIMSALPLATISSASRGVAIMPTTLVAMPVSRLICSAIGALYPGVVGVRVSAVTPPEDTST